MAEVTVEKRRQRQGLKAIANWIARFFADQRKQLSYVQVQRICINELVRRHQAKEAAQKDQKALMDNPLTPMLLQHNMSTVGNKTDKDSEEDLTLDDVVIAVENCPPNLKPGDSYYACRNQRWALNIRRRVYDCLNILCACDYLNEPELGYFDFNYLGKSLIEQQLEANKAEVSQETTQATPPEKTCSDQVECVRMNDPDSFLSLLQDKQRQLEASRQRTQQK